MSVEARPDLTAARRVLQAADTDIAAFSTSTTSWRRAATDPR